MNGNVKLTKEDVDAILARDENITYLLDHSEVMLSIVDEFGHLVRVNKRFTEVLGYSKEELVGESYFQIIHEDDVKKTLTIWDELVSKSKESTGVEGFTNRYVCKDGRIAVLEWHANTKSIKGLAISFAIFRGYES
jgi:PAS domain S-box-containing protein